MSRVPIAARAIGFSMLWIGMIVWTWRERGEREAIESAIFSLIFALTGFAALLGARYWARRRAARQDSH